MSAPVKGVASVTLRLDPSGCGTVLLDGQDISDNVRAVTVHARANEPTRVTVELAIGKPLDAELRDAAVEVTHPSAGANE